MSREVSNCYQLKAYDAALVMQFIEQDTWAFLTRPADMKFHGRQSFMGFTDKYLRDDPGQGYSYRALDVYAARCGLLHTFGSIADLHGNSGAVLWRYHLGQQNTFVPGMDRMAYISVHRFIEDAQRSVTRCCAGLKSDTSLNKLVGDRLPRVYSLAGILPSRDPDAIAAMDPGIDAEVAKLDAASGIIE